MYKTSKKLNHGDDSGEALNSKIFANKNYENLCIDFDRIHYNFKDECWIIVQHFLITELIVDFQEIPVDIKHKIAQLNSFKALFKKTTGEEVRLVMDLYFPKNDTNENQVLIVSGLGTVKAMSISNFSYLMRRSNFYGERKNVQKIYTASLSSNKSINDSRQNNSAFSLSKACLGLDVTYGFNIDKIIFNEDSNEITIFEYLLCEEAQTVTPYTSHPNKYFNKNAQKFINLFTLSQKLNAPLYLINYAKPGTIHEDKVLLMYVVSLDKNNISSPINSTNARLTMSAMEQWLENKFLTVNAQPSLKKLKY